MSSTSEELEALLESEEDEEECLPKKKPESKTEVK